MRFRFLVPLPQHRIFQYQPRFYDEAKEDLRNRQESIAKALREKDDSFSKELIKKRIGFAFQRRKHQENTVVWIRILFVALMMFLLWKWLL
ncbi:MAG: hypothetical protein NZM38_06055 [Cytophagales bacterium]|nr:hypothetical protein [Cytophagales bacterium]MDW8384319.1 hypothetical protein [Flammeovirgaceae bacterium]